MNSSHLSNKAAIGKYVSMYGSQLAICNFSNKLGGDQHEGCFGSELRKKYLVEISC